jgi:hypothetical protein
MPQSNENTPPDDDAAPQDEAVREAAEHASRSVQERREMARKATKSDDADSHEESAELQRAAHEHGRASHEQEDKADERAREADAEADRAED